MNKEWLVLEIGTYRVYASWFNESGNTEVKTYNNVDINNSRYSESLNAFTPLIIEIIKKRSPKNVLFVIPPGSDDEFKKVLYIEAKKVEIQEIMFLESDDAVIAYYSYLNETVLDDETIVYDFGYDNTCVSHFVGLEKKETHNYVKSGLLAIGASFSKYIYDKYSKSLDVEKRVMPIIEQLCMTDTVSIDTTDEGIIIARSDLDKVFDESYSLIDAIELSDSIKRIVLVGAGVGYPHFMELLLTKIQTNNIDTRIVKGFTSSKGKFTCDTSAVLGALHLLLSAETNGEWGKFFTCLKNRIGKYEGEAIHKFVIQCKVCGKLIPDRFNDDNNRFCPYCGKRLVDNH